MSKFYNIFEEYEEIFYKMPRFLFTSDYYRYISNDSKVGYMLLKDRFNDSVKNHWIDSEGHIYFVFTNSELGDMLNVGKNKVTNIKNELINANLLKVVKQGFDPNTGKNLPSRLYLLQPHLTAADVYSCAESKALGQEPYGNLKIKSPENTSSTLQTDKKYTNLKSNHSENNTSALQRQGSLKNKLYQNKDLEDTKKIHKDTPTIDFSPIRYSRKIVEKQNRALLKDANNFMIQDSNAVNCVLAPEAIKWLGMWCKTPREEYRIVQIILNAKRQITKDFISRGYDPDQVKAWLYINGQGEDDYKAQDEYLERIRFESHQYQTKIVNTLKKVIFAIRRHYDQGDRILNQEGYIFQTFKKLFTSIILDKIDDFKLWKQNYNNYR